MRPMTWSARVAVDRVSLMTADNGASVKRAAHTGERGPTRYPGGRLALDATHGQKHTRVIHRKGSVHAEGDV